MERLRSRIKRNAKSCYRKLPTRWQRIIRKYFHSIRGGIGSHTNSQKQPSTFKSGTLLPTSRILVDIVTPLGPNSEIDELSGVLSSLRGLANGPYRWIVVTDPDREQAVKKHIAWMFDFHGQILSPAKVSVTACPKTGAGPKRNQGAGCGNAPFVVFIDSDDRIDLNKLSAAVAASFRTALPLQSVHLFPYLLQTSEGCSIKVPNNHESAVLTHHHCARIWPSGIFRSGAAKYTEHDFEDAIFLVEMASRINQQCHVDPEAAFLTYADHRNDSLRLTRSYKSCEKLLEMFATAASNPNSSEMERKPSPREIALHRALVGRVAAQIAWAREPTAVTLREAFRTLEPYWDRFIGFGVEKSWIEQSLEGVWRRDNRDPDPAFKKRTISFLHDELSALRPRLLDSHSPRNEARWSESKADSELGLLLGLMNSRNTPLRSALEAPTVEFNLPGERYHKALAGLKFYLTEPRFHLRENGSIPEGEIRLRDSKSRDVRRIGNFNDDRLISSKILRLYDSVYPSINQVEEARSQVIFESLHNRLPEGSVVRLLGTGPSSSRAFDAQDKNPNVLTVCCNSWVCDPAEMVRVGAQFLTAADPIFHAGPSEYARQFRKDVVTWLRLSEEHLFVTVGRDVEIYLREFPLDVHDRVVAPVFEPKLDTSIRLSLSSGRVQPYPNVLTLLMFPLAELLRPSEIILTGFDGGSSTDSEFWRYEKRVNYSESLQHTVREWHGEFFRMDFDEYRDVHARHVVDWVAHLKRQGISLRSLSPSHIPPINGLYTPE